MYNDYKILRFGLNNKNIKINKLITYLTQFTEHIKTIFKNKYENIQIEYPWKEYTNYPYMINFNITNNLIFTDTDKNDIELSSINVNLSYSLLFELSYIQIVKINDEYILKLKLSIIMIQLEPQMNLKNFLLSENKNDTYNTYNFGKSIIDINKNPSPIPINIDKKPIPEFRSVLSLNDILNKKNNLRKVAVENDNEDKKEKNFLIEDFLIQKEALRKVETLESKFLDVSISDINSNLENCDDDNTEKIKRNKKIKKSKKDKKDKKDKKVKDNIVL
jgi:hypothetical protein